MPELSVAEYEALDPNVLEAKRRALITKADGNHDNLEIEDLRELAAIVAVLRRRSSGPPKAAKTKTTKARGPATADDLA